MTVAVESCPRGGCVFAHRCELRLAWPPLRGSSRPRFRESTIVSTAVIDLPVVDTKARP